MALILKFLNSLSIQTTTRIHAYICLSTNLCFTKHFLCNMGELILSWFSASTCSRRELVGICGTAFYTLHAIFVMQQAVLKH